MRLIAPHANIENLYKFFDMDFVEIADDDIALMTRWGMTTLKPDTPELVIGEISTFTRGTRKDVVKAFEEKLEERKTWNYQIYVEKDETKQT